MSMAIAPYPLLNIGSGGCALHTAREITSKIYLAFRACHSRVSRGHCRLRVAQ